MKVGTEFEFRNPVHFVQFTDLNVRDAEYETEAVLDHLFFHDNTAPFVAHRLIQRFTSSNPSPRYVTVVADAFRTGTYGGTTYSGKYGDLGATIEAILRNREARNPMAVRDPHHGKLREPILKPCGAALPFAEERSVRYVGGRRRGVFADEEGVVQ